MNLLDFAVLAFILLLAVRGYFRGFFRELFGLAAWLGAGIVAYLFGPTYGPAVSGWSGQGERQVRIRVCPSSRNISVSE